MYYYYDYTKIACPSSCPILNLSRKAGGDAEEGRRRPEAKLGACQHPTLSAPRAVRPRKTSALPPALGRSFSKLTTSVLYGIVWSPPDKEPAAGSSTHFVRR